MTRFTEPLAQYSCEACRADAPRLSHTEYLALQQQIPGWEKVEEQGVSQLTKVFAFNNFVQAMAFANQVGTLAESESHHPAILVEWGKVTVRWWTHKIQGLHRNDVIMAAKTDLLSQ